MKLPKYSRTKSPSAMLNMTSRRWISNRTFKKQYQRMPRGLKKDIKKFFEHFKAKLEGRCLLDYESPQKAIYRLTVLLTPKVQDIVLRSALKASKSTVKHAGLNVRYINKDGSQMSTNERIVAYPEEINLYQTIKE